MGFWDWFTTENRESSFTNLVVGHLLASAEGTNADAGALAVLETASGLYGRAFSLADVTPASRRTLGLNPCTLELIGRELIRSGEIVLVPEVGPGGLALLPASDWDITGGANPQSWIYRVTLPGPSSLLTRNLPASGVIHCQYARSPIHPWRGVSPLTRAKATGKIAANLEVRLGEEMAGRSGHLLPVPGDPGDSRFDGLKADLAGLRGNTAMVSSTASGFEQGPAAGGRAEDWKPIRFGADPPESLDAIRTSTGRAILGACGVPVALADPGSSAGTALREGLRQFLHLSVQPLGALVAAELAAKLEVPGLMLKFRRLHAADIAGRARAYGSLVNAKSGETPAMDPDRAAAIAGLED